MSQANLLREALGSSQCVISIVGRHAGEDPEGIFARKIEDIRDVGWTLWVMYSCKARPDRVQELCEKLSPKPVYVIFTRGGKATKSIRRARRYLCSPERPGKNDDRSTWQRMPKGMGDVTGISEKQRTGTALCFDRIELVDGVRLDMRGYAEPDDPSQPARTGRGFSTLCVVKAKEDMSKHPRRLRTKSVRPIAAIARLAEPYCVWVE